jgi:FHS family L-fucose permease-like MFS transporter
LYGLGALLAIPAIIHHSFAGFCICIFIIGNGLGSLETAANPYITGERRVHATIAASLGSGKVY